MRSLSELPSPAMPVTCTSVFSQAVLGADVSPAQVPVTPGAVPSRKNELLAPTAVAPVQSALYVPGVVASMVFVAGAASALGAVMARPAAAATNAREREMCMLRERPNCRKLAL